METTLKSLPLLPLFSGVVYPEMVVTIALESEEAKAAAAAADDELAMVTRLADGRFTKVGLIARIENRGQLPNGTDALMVRVTHRARLGAGVIGTGRALWVDAEPFVEAEPTARTEELATRYREVATQLLDELGGSRLAGALPESGDPGALADTIAYWPDLSIDQRVALLETLDVDDRLAMATRWAEQALAQVEVTRSVRDGVTEKLESEQREALLRRQMQAIRNELGEGDDDVIGEYRRRLDEMDAAETVKKSVAKEIDRLEQNGQQSMEASWIRTWLDTVMEVPWGERSESSLDLEEARVVLDRDHTGLEDVKDRLVEYLAVRKLRHERGVDDTAPNRRRGGVILALVGPPGVGKTSLGESVAEALGRSFVRMALGGIRDESEIRGHRRTYVGARPGRVVRALTEAGSMNPVILLDEIDKVGADWRGDPSSALLEVLDPAQNHSFRDHYLEFELDLSDVVFIATANRLDTIPAALLDRLEIIAVDGYTDDEKTVIARDHLVPRLIERTALQPDEVTITDEAMAAVAADWTREAGVRGLERQLEKVLRKSATSLAKGEKEPPLVVDVADLDALLGKPIPREVLSDRTSVPGVATGLAVTGSGGEVLFVEATSMPGEPGLTLTGQLGDVMKESGEIARSYLRSHAEALGLGDVDKRFHVHFPAGAVPKDGPSAGITMTTALVSLLSGRMVRPEVGMTGEVTLHGKVLPIGGVKQKLLAAHRAGLKEVVIPARNERDLDDVPEEVRNELIIHLVDDVAQVLELALVA